MPNPVASEVGTFEKGKLKHVNPEEKNVLPTADDVQKEKQDKNLMSEIEHGTTLNKVKTVEKNSLPTKEDIEAEKKGK